MILQQFVKRVTMMTNFNHIVKVVLVVKNVAIALQQIAIVKRVKIEGLIMTEFERKIAAAIDRECTSQLGTLVE